MLIVRLRSDLTYWCNICPYSCENQLPVKSYIADGPKVSTFKSL